MDGLMNNLFNYATKELSQDAFICWICSYALEKADSTDVELLKCAHKLICEFMRRGIGEAVDAEKIKLKKIERQYENIDVLLTVDYLGNVYKIIVEDKIHSSEHDNQLERYKKLINSDSIQVIGIYYKTGFQSDFSEIEKAGYKLFSRSDVISLLKECKSENAILNNYLQYWETFEEITQSYKRLPLDKWEDWQPVNGFYDNVQTVLTDKGYWANYGYVSNKSGGFWGLWYGVDDNFIEKDNLKVNIYLQIETKWNYEVSKYEYRICVKLENASSVAKNDEVKSIRDYIVDELPNYHFYRPTYLRYGTYMTVGIYDVKTETNEWNELINNILSSVEQYKQLIERVKVRFESEYGV